MLWPPPLARVSEVPVPLHGRSPLGGHLATIAPLTLHAIDDGLSHAACGSVPLAGRCSSACPVRILPRHGVSRGRCREASPVRSHPDPDDPQMRFLDPTPRRYD